VLFTASVLIKKTGINYAQIYSLRRTNLRLKSFIKKPNGLMVKKVFVLFCLQLLFIAAGAQSLKSRWVDSVFNTLNVNEKIGQLFLVPVSSQTDEAVLSEIESLIKSHDIGGIIFTTGTPVRQAYLTNRFQSLSKVPLLVAQDAEWGLGTTMDSTISYPRALVLGAIEDDTLIYRLGHTIANQLKAVGVNLNFAPVTGVHTKNFNAQINYRSFGEEKQNVRRKSLAFMRGLQDHGVLACAKNFPIEGLTILDIERGFPVLLPTIDSVQLYPFTALFNNGLAGVMPAATDFPLFYQNISLAKKNKYNASTLTSLFTGDWLKKNMHYEGLTFADIQQVQIITDKDRAGEAEMFAFMAGNDVLISPKDIGPAIRQIRRLIRKESAYEAQLDHTVKKILAAKFSAGLWKREPINTDNLIRSLNSSEAQLLNQQLYEAAVTILRNEKNTLPIKSLDARNFAYVTSEASEPNTLFYKYLNKYVNTAYFTADERTDMVELSGALSKHDVIIVGIFPQTTSALIGRLQRVLGHLATTRDIIYCDFGNEAFLQQAAQHSTVITGYVNSRETVMVVPQVIYGALPGIGRLPVTVSAQLKAGAGIKTPAIDRLAYSVPEAVKMDGRVLQRVDSIAREAIRIGATPGCQVLIAKDGKVVYEKSFGYLTYDRTLPVTDETIYDLASITKVAATLQTTMFLYDHKIIDLNRKVSYYLPELKNTNKKDITLIDMLTHQAGLVPFIPMWPQTVKDTLYLPVYYSRSRNDQYPYQISPNLYGSQTLKDSVWHWIKQSKLTEKSGRTPYSYKYSDLGFLILQQLAERILNQPMDEFLAQNLYEPLGAYTVGFNPLDRFPKQTIAPTEDDKIFRKTFVSGTVHDERAAMLGGVAGHAGLFGNASDLAKLGQMLLQGGKYGGYQYYKPETVRTFTGRKYLTSRRGIGWDKPLQSDWSSPTSLYASPATFGHTGFTGTCIWIDPEFNVLYIFLSNRVYPDRNNKLSNANIRSRIQDVIYQSIFKYEQMEKPRYIVGTFPQ
jgi:beta-N-acetylhexosaminidase